MGKLHYGKAPRPINKASEYLLIGGGETKKQADAVLLQKLKTDEYCSVASVPLCRSDAGILRALIRTKLVAR